MEIYDFHRREQNLAWSILHIKTLLDIAQKQKSSSLIIYAALEGRIILERIMFEILVMSAHDSMDLDWIDLIEEHNGIQKVNSKYKALKFRYQTFTEAFSTIILDDFSLKPFDFKKAEDFITKLSQYIHIYTRKQDEILFESEFMQSGVTLILEIIYFLENMFTLHDNQYVFGTVNFSSLKNGMEIEFEKWLKTPDEDVVALTNRLREIRDKKL
jgi:hypothetical protein